MKPVEPTSVITPFEQLGGELVLRRIIDRFVDRVFEDPMIGFFFASASRERIKEKEYEFAAAHLGAPVEYTGRPLPEAHARHPIMGGHFMRRYRILEQTLQESGAPPAVIERWLAHTEKLRPAITRHQGSDCAHEPAHPVTRLPLAFTPTSAARRPLPLVVANPKKPDGDKS